MQVIYVPTIFDRLDSAINESVNNARKIDRIELTGEETDELTRDARKFFTSPVRPALGGRVTPKTVTYRGVTLKLAEPNEDF